MLRNFIRTRVVKEQDKMMNSPVLTLKTGSGLAKQQAGNVNVGVVLNSPEESTDQE
jgi:hypothetical protein